MDKQWIPEERLLCSVVATRHIHITKQIFFISHTCFLHNELFLVKAISIRERGSP
jgi:hypothetical protein